MKIPIEPSTISRSQSEASATSAKSKLLRGTTEKLDSFFPFLDQISLNSHLPLTIYFIGEIYLYYQIFFSSMYPFNKYWFQMNENGQPKLISILYYLEKIAWFFQVEDESSDFDRGTRNGETDLQIPSITIIILFIISTLIILIEIFGTSRHHKVRKVYYFLIRFIFDILSPAMLIPVSAVIGNSIRNLVQSNNKMNWGYLLFGFILYLIFLFYTYIGFTILNSSVCISMTLFSSFNAKIPLLLVTISSLYLMLQCVLSLFHGWAMVIVQLTHILVCLFYLQQMYYLVFHSTVANVVFIGVILSTWINDVVFTILYFIPKPSGNATAFYLVGFLLPLFSLIISHVASFLFVYFKLKSVKNQLVIFSDSDLNENNQEMNKLFQNESDSLMSLHVAFLNALPFFYNLSSLNYLTSRFPTIKVMMEVIQYLSFFPGESRKLNNYLKVITKSRELNFHQRFLLYQILRMKMLRQSSVSSDANHRLAEMKTLSNQCCEEFMPFWGSKNANILFIEMISDTNRKVNMKWEECIRDFPNNPKFSDEYCSYLIECQMDLPKALVMRYRTNLIEMGKNFTIDTPFIYLARCLPIYLRNGIVDYQGSFQSNKDKTNSFAQMDLNGTQNSTTSTTNLSGGSGISLSSSFSASMLSSMNLDQDLEENLGRQLFRQANLRLEMHRALGNRKSYASKLILFTAYISLIVSIVFSFVVYYDAQFYIDYRYDSCYYLNLASKTNSYLNLAMLGSTLKFAYFTDRFTAPEMFDKLESEDEEKDVNDGLFVIDDQISYSIIHQNSLSSREYFREFLASLSDLAFIYGEDIYTYAYLLMHNEVPFVTCFKGVPTSKVNMSLKSLESYIFLAVEMSASKTVEEGTWYNSDEVCEIMANQPLFQSSMNKLYITLMNHEIDQCLKEFKILDVLKIALPIIIFVIDFVPMMILIRLFIKDCHKLLELLKSIDSRFKEEAKNPIRKDNVFENYTNTEKRYKVTKWILWVVMIFIISVGMAIIILLLVFKTYTLNKEVEKMAKWNFYSIERLCISVESLNYVLNAVLLNGSTSLNISSSNKIATREKMIELAKESIEQLEIANEALLKGRNGSFPCHKFDEVLDFLSFSNVCVVENNNTDMHDSYRCCSVSTSVGIFVTMMRAMLDDLEDMDGKMDKDTVYHSIHMLSNHLFSRLEEFVDRLTEINETHCETMQMEALIIFIAGIVVAFIHFVVLFFFYRKSVSIFNVGMVLTQRLPPNAFISNKTLLHFVMSKKMLKSESEMSTSQSAIYMSLDGIVCTNVSGVVEIINPAVTNMLGYTPDQMLGQHISSIFSDNCEEEQNEDKENDKNKNKNKENDNENNENNENNNDNANNNESGVNEVKKKLSDAEKISNRLELMMNGQCALVFEDHFVCMTDDAKEMPCGVTILGMTSGNDGDGSSGGSSKGAKVESFVVILRDETQLMQQQKEAEAAKAQSENLLYQILPRDIVVRLNSGEKDISFTVQSASIIFTDVVRFSEYASSLSPQEIMGSLSTLFAAFDTSAKHYELITKIKLIGDIYMAAAGLFSKESIAPNAHAEEILKFGLECLAQLDEVNIRLNANLQLRVGINSGGPLLAGVLGTDKPVFDIIGDPINVAARLQTTDIPGKIQIPQSTYDLVHEGPYTIEERGEVFLKGKGKTMAYLVSPTISTNASFYSTPSQNLL